MLGGSDLETSVQTGPAQSAEAAEADMGSGPETETYAEVQQRLAGLGGESAVMAQALRHIITRVTDEGLVIEMFDLPGTPLFDGETDAPEAVLRTLAGILARALAVTSADLAVAGHVQTFPIVRAVDPRWPLSAARAGRMRELLEGAGIDPDRMARVTGHADRRPALPDAPMDRRNNRLEVIVLRPDPSGQRIPAALGAN